VYWRCQVTQPSRFADALPAVASALQPKATQALITRTGSAVRTEHRPEAAVRGVQRRTDRRPLADPTQHFELACSLRHHSLQRRTLTTATLKMDARRSRDGPQRSTVRAAGDKDRRLER
jgi:hypothetical protein